MKFKRTALIVSLSFLAACGSDSTSPSDIINGAISGSLSFNYTGGGGGSYSATGAITSAALASSPFTTTWAIGFKNATDNSTNVAANIPKTTNVSDIAAISVKGQSTGTFSIDPACTVTKTSTCNDVSLFIGQNSSTGTFGSVCTLTAGSIGISSLSSTNATGVFSGSGSCVSSAGSVSTWVVLNGTFNVPVLASVPSTIP